MIKLFLLFSLTLLLNSADCQQWKSLYDRALKEHAAGKFNEALETAGEAVKASKAELGNAHPDVAVCIQLLGSMYRLNGRLKDAEPHLREASDIFLKVFGRVHIEYGASLNMLGLLYYSSGNYDSSRVYYQKAIEVFKANPGQELSRYASVINNLALLLKTLGEYGPAEALYIESKDLRKKTIGTNTADYAGSCNNLAGLYKQMGDYEKAKALFLESAEIVKTIYGVNHPEYAKVINNIADIYYRTAEYDKAERNYQSAISIQKAATGKTSVDLGSYLFNLGMFYRNIKLYEAALPRLEEAKEIFTNELGPENLFAARCNVALGEIKTITGDYVTAVNLFLEAEKVLAVNPGKWTLEYAICMNGFGVLNISLKRYTTAESFLKLGLRITEDYLGNQHATYATYLNNLALLYEETGESEKADSLYGLSVSITRKSVGRGHRDYADLTTNLVLKMFTGGRYEDSYSFLQELNSLPNQLNTFNVLSESEKKEYIEMTSTLLHINLNYILRSKSVTDSFLLSSLNKQLLYKSLILSNTQQIRRALENSNDPEVVKLFSKWQAEKKYLLNQYALSEALRDKQLDQKEKEAEENEKKLYRKIDFNDPQLALAVTMGDVQEKMEEDEVAVEFFSFNMYDKEFTDRIFYGAFVFGKHDAFPKVINLGTEDTLTSILDAGGSTASSVAKRGFGLVNRASADQQEKLYTLLWKPLEPHFKGKKKISYSPAGKLFKIAFHSLNTDKSSLLMDQYDLRQYTSIKDIAFRASQKSVSLHNILLIGDPDFDWKFSTGLKSSGSSWDRLKGTAEEVRIIEQLFKKKSLRPIAYTGEQATKGKLTSSISGKPDVLHIATHGYFIPVSRKEETLDAVKDPLLRSGIVLAGANYVWGEDVPNNEVKEGVVSALEISQFNLSHTELVVLSACETALGDIEGTEGVYGLQRAFKMAGVKKMIVSLWSVPDKETAELMTVFYGYLLAGDAINVAFKKARADMRKKYSPFYWAAFVLVE